MPKNTKKNSAKRVKFDAKNGQQTSETPNTATTRHHIHQNQHKTHQRKSVQANTVLTEAI